MTAPRRPGRPPPLRKLVYWSAFVPASGRSLMVPQPYQYFTETVKPIVPETLGVPAAYVLSELDIALPPQPTSDTFGAATTSSMKPSAAGASRSCSVRNSSCASVPCHAAGRSSPGRSGSRKGNFR